MPRLDLGEVLPVDVNWKMRGGLNECRWRVLSIDTAGSVLVDDFGPDVLITLAWHISHKLEGFTWRLS